MNTQNISPTTSYSNNGLGWLVAAAVAIVLMLAAGLRLAVAAPVLAADEDQATTTSEEAGGATGTETEAEEGEQSITTKGICSGVSLDLDNEDCENEEADRRVVSTIKNIINLFSIAAGTATVIMIIYAGFRYVVSGGDEKGVKGAKNTVIYAVVGIILVALAQAIVVFILNQLLE
ncbi:hypothetical protein F4X86_03735 [Candidatus Saccharibacteria bacterium]|nr:hypothetical protein [Candidatus Saccharibacteria bacterium]